MTHLNTHGIDPPPLDEPVWYAFRSERRSGALRLNDLRRMVEQDVLRKDDLIWRPGWEQWISAQDVPDLFPERGQPPARPVNSKHLKLVPAGGNVLGTKKEKRTLKEKALDETKTFFLMFIYLWTIFGMLTLLKSVVMEKQGLDYQLHGLALINALVLGKVMLLAEGLHLGRRFENRAPYHAILMKSVLFVLAFLCFHVLEHVAIGFWKGEAIWDSIPSGAVHLKETMIISFIVALALVPYFAFKEIEMLTGETELLAAILGQKPRPASNADDGTK
jgi:hypothetical protein